MIPISAIFDKDSIAGIVLRHINNKTVDLIKWYSEIRKPSAFLPEGFSDSVSKEAIELLLESIESPKVKELSDWKLRFALSCFLEEEERIIVKEQELSASFSAEDRRILEEYLPEKDIEYYESYDNFRGLIIPDSSYLDMAMEYNL